MSVLEKLIIEKKKATEDRNEFLFSFEKRDEVFLAPLLKKGDKFVRVFTITVCLHMMLSRVDATMVLVRGEKQLSAHRVHSITTPNVANAIALRWPWDKTKVYSMRIF